MILWARRLQKIAQNQQYKAVTLEWSADDVAEVFRSQFAGSKEDMYEPIEYFSGFDDMTQRMAVHIDYVRHSGKNVGIASGKTYAYHENRMISLAKVDPALAVEGQELTILWGTPEYKQKEIYAVVAPFPYYNGEFRNEKFDVLSIPQIST